MHSGKGSDDVSSHVATWGCPDSFKRRKGDKDTSKASAEEVEEVNNDHFGNEEDRNRGPLSVDDSIAYESSMNITASVGGLDAGSVLCWIWARILS